MRYRAWAIVRKLDNKIFDDSTSYGEKDAYCYPIFKRKIDAQLYIRKTFPTTILGRRFPQIAKAKQIEFLIPPPVD